MKWFCTFILFLPSAFLYGQSGFHDTWADPVLICSARTYTTERLGPAYAFSEATDDACIKADAGIARQWFRFKAGNASSLSFAISPHDENDDIDFILYKSDNGIPAGILRCMATGVRMDRSRASQPHCTGATGLAPAEQDVIEKAGCSGDQNNFLAAVQTSPGDEYLLLVTNYRSENGFTIEWTGTTLFSDRLCSKHVADEGSVTIRAFPVPAREHLTAVITTGEPVEGHLLVIHPLGMIRESITVSLLPGENQVRINTNGLNAGLHFIALISEGKYHANTRIEIFK